MFICFSCFIFLREGTHALKTVLQIGDTAVSHSLIKTYCTSVRRQLEAVLLFDPASCSFDKKQKHNMEPVLKHSDEYDTVHPLTALPKQCLLSLVPVSVYLYCT